MLPEPLDSGDFYAPRAFGLGGFFMLPEPLDSGDFLPARLGLENLQGFSVIQSSRGIALFYAGISVIV